MKEKSNFLAYIFLLLTVTFWAGNFIVGKFASHYEVPPFSLNFYRWFFKISKSALVIIMITPKNESITPII